MKKSLIYLKLAIGIFIIWFISKKIGFTNITSVLLKINVTYIPLIVVLYLVTLLISCYKLKIILDSQSYKSDFWRFFMQFLTSISVGMFLPGKIGDFSLSYFLKKEYNVKVSHSFSAILIDKVITLTFFILITLTGISILFSELIKSYINIAIAILIFGVVFITFILYGRSLIKLIFGKYYENFVETTTFSVDIVKHKNYLLMINLFLTLIRSVVLTFMYYFAFLSFSYNISFINLFFINSISIFISVIPISISGLGIREGSAVFLLDKLNVPNTITFNSFIIVTIVIYLIAIINLILYKHKN